MVISSPCGAVVVSPNMSPTTRYFPNNSSVSLSTKLALVLTMRHRQKQFVTRPLSEKFKQDIFYISTYIEQLNIFSGYYPLNHNMNTKTKAKNSKSFPSLQDYCFRLSVFTIAPSLISDLIGSFSFSQIRALLLADNIFSGWILSPRSDCILLTAGQAKMVPSLFFPVPPPPQTWKKL